MSIILAKYATELTIQFPMIVTQTGDFAGDGDWTPASGDAKGTLDGAAMVTLTNVPTLVTGEGSPPAGSYLWSLTLTAAELTGKRLTIQLVDSPVKSVNDNAIIIETYGHASAQHPFDLSLPFLTQLMTGLNTAQTEAYAAAGAAASVVQMLYFTQQVLTEFVKSGTAITIKKLDGSTTAAELTLDDGDTPLTVTRSS